MAEEGNPVRDIGPSATRERVLGGTFVANASVPVDAGNDLQARLPPNSQTTSLVLTLTCRGAGGQVTTVTRTVYPGGSTIVCGSGFSSVMCNVSAGNYEIGPHNSLVPDALLGQRAAYGQETQIATAVLAPTTVANGTSLTVGTAGNNTVNLGNMVFYNLSAFVIGTAAEALGYVGIVGHTSGTWYAVVVGNGSSSGSFPMTNTAEKLDISYANAFASSMAVSGIYWAVAP